MLQLGCWNAASSVWSRVPGASLAWKVTSSGCSRTSVTSCSRAAISSRIHRPSLPPSWHEHLMRERSCLVITGVDLQLAAEGMVGIERAVSRGDAFAGMVLINEGLR